jgi:GNAT superfamily N-acetyltransferase
VVTVSADDSLLDIDTIHRWLSEDAYWSLGRSRDTVERSLRQSVNLGAYEHEDGSARPTQVGFLRMVTDRATFAWLCDVYVDPVVRGRGVGRALVGEAHRLLGGWGVKRALLATADAHELYAEYGFAPLAEPERWMVRGYDR